VPFDQVERTMGRGRINPVFVRPVLHSLGFVTPRMFETFAADTVPLLPADLKNAARLYGDRISPLCPTPGASAGDRVLEILRRYHDYVELAREIGERLAQEHSYEVRLEELLGFGR